MKRPGGELGSYRILSRHTGGNSGRFSVEGRHLNAGCVLPGSPFAPGLVLGPNDPGEEPPTVTLGPISTDAIGAVTSVFVRSEKPASGAPITVSAQLLDSSGEAGTESQLVLASGERGALTLELGRVDGDDVRLRLRVTSEEDGDPAIRGSVELYYLSAFSRSELVPLLNAAGSDKGSEVFWGDAAPHFFAMEYERLFSPFRDERFNLLEIGLDAATYSGGQPVDAPSMRAWRQFFPNATLYGYDLNDFGFLDQPGTVVFQGDQASREDIARFLESTGRPRFRIVIDDGSHASSHQQISLASFFGSVEDGGVYTIEDLNWQPFEESPTTREVLDHFSLTGRIESPFITEPEARELESMIAEVTLCWPNDVPVALISKKSTEPQSSPSLPGGIRRLITGR